MRNTPLLPRSCPSPFGGDGVDHSTWSWQSPNASLVEILPAPGETTRSPDSIFQRAGLLPSVACHFDRSVPPNNTSASDGGAPSDAPGDTTLGCGRLLSWTCHFPPGNMGVSV